MQLEIGKQYGLPEYDELTLKTRNSCKDQRTRHDGTTSEGSPFTA